VQLVVAFLLAVNTTAVWLTIHLGASRSVHALLPSPAKILIEKIKPSLSGDQLTQLFDQLMVLVSGVEQGGRKTRKAPLLCNCGAFQEAIMVAKPAALSLPEDDTTEKILQTIVVINDGGEILLLSKFVEGLKPFSKFSERVNIRVMEQGCYLVSLLSEGGKRVDCAGTAAAMKENLLVHQTL
jgi:hypothetical protein